MLLIPTEELPAAEQEKQYDQYGSDDECNVAKIYLFQTSLQVDLIISINLLIGINLFISNLFPEFLVRTQAPIISHCSQLIYAEFRPITPYCMETYKLVVF